MIGKYTVIAAFSLATSMGIVAGCSRPATTDAEAAKEGAKAGEAHGEGDGHTHGKAASAGGPLKLSNDEIAAAGIEVADVQETELAERVHATAVVRPNQSRLVRIAPRIPGRIVAVNVNSGDRVRAGQTLATLDSIELGEARAAYLQAQAELALARANLDRTEKLLAEEIIAAKEHVRAKSDFEKARIVASAAAEKLRLLGAASEGSIFPVVAPFAATVIERNDAVAGTLAQPDRPLFTLADLSVVWVEANLHERDLGRVAVGNAADVSVTAYPDTIFRGKITQLANVMDKETRTVPARIEVPNADGRLKPEMFARVAIATAAKGKALVVPNEAVVLMQGNPAVFIEGDKGFEARPIEIGERLDGRVTVMNGLRPGETIVVKGTYALKARQLKSQIGEGHAH